MAVALRMSRRGNRNRPFYRVNAVDSRTKRDGRVLEQLGHFNPLERDETKQVELKLDRCAYWLSVGATPSSTVATLLRRKGLKTAPGTKVEAQTLPAPVVAAVKPAAVAAAPVA